MTRFMSICALLVLSLWTTALSAQQTYRLLTARGDTLSSEEFTAAGEQFSADVKVPPMDLYFTVSARGSGSERTFVLEGVMKGLQQKLEVLRRGDSLSATMTSATGSTAIPPKAIKAGEPFVVFMNFAFTFVAEQLAKIALRDDKPQSLQVLTMDSFEVQTWTVRRRAADVVELFAPNGQMLAFRFDGARLLDLSVPNQGLKLVPSK